MNKFLLPSAVLALAFASVSCLAQTPAPDFDLPAGSYSRPIALEITDSVTLTIYYTTDGTPPTTSSPLYTAPVTIGPGTITVQALAVSEAGNSPITSATYIVAPPDSFTSLQSSAPALVLPGALTLTATVNTSASGGAVPTGSITFNSNTSSSLGTAPLKLLPATEIFSREAVLTNPLANPAGLDTLLQPTSPQPALISAQTAFVYPNDELEVALYKLSPGGDSFNTYTYTRIDQNYFTDAIVGGYFLQPKSSGAQSILVHEYRQTIGQYSLLPGTTNTTGGTLNLDAPLVTGGSPGCGECSQPDYETLSVADFNNDGFSDLAFFIQPYTYSAGVVYAGVPGIAINPGPQAIIASGTIFPSFLYAPTPSGFTYPTVYCPIAIATGNFTSSPNPQLAVLAGTANTSCGAAFSALTVYFFAYDSTSQTLVQTGTPITLPDTNAISLAAADLNGDGIADLVIGESITGTTATTGGILTAIAVGDGSFQTLSSLVSVNAVPVSFAANDFNADGHTDVAYTTATGYSILFGDGTGNFSKRANYTYNPATIFAPVGLVTADFNGDGLPDLASLPDSNQGVVKRPLAIPSNLVTLGSNVDISLNSASAQAVLPLGPQALPAGAYSLTASYPGDNNFAASKSAAVAETVTQTIPVLTWTGSGSTLNVGTPLSTAQLNAAANVPGTFTYTPGLGTILPLGNTTLTTAFAPTDSFDYAPAAASLALSVVAPTAVATLSAAETTVTAGQQSTITLTVQPYPIPVTATATLTFTPNPPNTVSDPTVLFSNNATTQAIPINPGTAASSTPFLFQAGSTAGTITVTIHLTLPSGQDVTPETLQPVTVTVPAAAPAISSVTLARSGQSMQVTVIALSSTRDMTEAQFHLTPVSGKTLTTTDVTVQLGSAFQGWYGSAASDPFGTNFTYTQPFTLDGPATDIQSISVTLVNSAGSSEPGTAQ